MCDKDYTMYAVANCFKFSLVTEEAEQLGVFEDASSTHWNVTKLVIETGSTAHIRPSHIKCSTGSVGYNIKNRDVQRATNFARVCCS